jgi:hypothetical protein
MRRRLALLLVALAAVAPLSPPARAGEGGDKKKTGGESYIPIETLTAFTLRPGGRRGVMTVDCGIDIPDAALRERAQLMLPRLRAAFVQGVQVYAGGLPYGLPPNPDYLARGLQRSTDQILGRRGARVLMGAVVVN